MREISAKRLSIPQNRIAHNLRTRLRHLVVRKDKSTLEYLGINKNEFKEWLEYQFDENMNWDNYGSYWQIDHVTPCASYDLTSEDNIYKCFNWTNMRPLEKKENNIKNNKIINDEILNHSKIVKKFKKEKNIIV